MILRLLRAIKIARVALHYGLDEILSSGTRLPA